ncbi:MAG: ABC transporter ATP-binding protein [Phycisphaerales bacterium]|nr:ABC transporter ATP-binding protein [Phycisphaerales bacterium]
MSDRQADAEVLSLRGVKFSYARAGDEAGEAFELNAGDLTVKAGEQVLVWGKSGAGKSTLLLVMAGLVEPSAGTVTVAGKDLATLRGGLRDEHRGRHIGMIFQTFNLLKGFSAAENVMAALMLGGVPAREHRARAEKLLGELGITQIDRAVERLSVGQQQRVAVARAVACTPSVVLADEPTASLDRENASAAMELIQSTCKRINAALVCVSHDERVAERFERKIELGRGA